MGSRAAPPSDSGRSRAPTVEHEDSIKTAKPDFYYGDRDKLNGWILQMDLYFRLQATNVPEKNKVALAATFMRGKALSWINTNLQDYLDDPDNADAQPWMESYARFKSKMRHNFGPSNETSVAVRVIQQLKQRKSAAEYTTQFSHYCAKTEWDDTALMTMYKRGLKESVKDELMRSGASLGTLELLMREAIDIDDRLYERAMEKRYDGGRGISFGKERQGYHRKVDTDHLGGDPMELDVLTKGKVKQFKSKGRGKKPSTKECYGCGKPGHLIRNCRSKNKVRRPQLNVIQKEAEPRDGPSMDGVPQAEDSSWEDIDTSEGEIGPEEWKEWWKGPYPSIDPDELEKQEQADIEAYSNLVTQPSDGTFVDSEEWWEMISRETGEPMDTPRQRIDWIQDQRRFKERKNPEPAGKAGDWVNDTVARITERIDSGDDNEEAQAPTIRQMIEDLESKEEEDLSPITGTAILPYYMSDPRNHRHAGTHHTFCYDEYCVWHVGHRGHGQTPKKPEGLICRHASWETCCNDMCSAHMYDKRKAEQFPGHSKVWNDKFDKMKKQRNSVARDCQQVTWHTCLQDMCPKHSQAKHITGYEPLKGTAPRQRVGRGSS